MKKIDLPPDETRARILEFLDAQRVMTLATARNGTPWTCTLTFAHDPELRLLFLSRPATRHCRDLEANPRVAVAIHDPDTAGDRGRARGLQAVGAARRLRGPEALAGLATFGTRFGRSVDRLRDALEVRHAGIYRVDLERAWLLDREDLGGRVELSLGGGHAGEAPATGGA